MDRWLSSGAVWIDKAGIRHKRGGAVDVEGHLERLGVAVTDIELEDATTSGLAVLPERGAPQIFVNRCDPRCEFPSGKARQNGFVSWWRCL